MIQEILVILDQACGHVLGSLAVNEVWVRQALQRFASVIATSVAIVFNYVSAVAIGATFGAFQYILAICGVSVAASFGLVIAYISRFPAVFADLPEFFRIIRIMPACFYAEFA